MAYSLGGSLGRRPRGSLITLLPTEDAYGTVRSSCIAKR